MSTRTTGPGPDPARWLALCAASTAATGAGLLLPAALGRALDLLLADAPATRWVLYCAALVLLLALLDAAETVLGGTVDARTTGWLRRRLHRHVLAVGPRAAERFGSGDLVARLVGNAAQAGTAPAARAALLAAHAGPVGGCVALALIDPWLTAVLLAGAPVLALLLRAFTRDTRDCVTRYQEVQGRIAGALAEAVDGHRTIRAAGTAQRETARILGPLPELSATGRRMWRVQGRAAGQSAAVAPLLQLTVVAVAGFLLTRDRLTVGELLAASRYAVLATGVGVLVGHLASLARARAATGRLGEVLGESPPAHGERRLPPGPGRLELRGVTARRGGRAVLDGVDLVVPGGTTLAVVGRSGAGKSLLAAVAGRLADPDDGEILLDGVPLRELSHDELRGAIGHAFERPALLGGTLEEEIGLGPVPASPAAVRDAARTAHADEFVRRLPAGYATLCADAPLSGGESQRLGLARAFAHGGRLLVLDDALSSLDTVTEARITASLVGTGRGGTRLLIAHRPATAARADAVAWLDDGRIRAVGPHERLWELAGYRAVFADGADFANDADHADFADEERP
ncbi:ABC transporter ATP-binding membrane translocator, AmfB [Streptomyces davaonensis JCM 4913]|uniref:ABC transporter ATP-binding membrane translocator, AmfB n=1 Tax=Streptomyces davaonensis (strain DSM 101723 / JCM 4913 / KCC S-0913 / 768) TaxID=1214101 RepID=K4QWK6_STRDJ|nr:ABC transporter ATP-binding protein [Streptomyces davaonensis]CCK25408.1 ABC transporter ATP-binding membrane translocator, AmfB [Streptomyces davaonensis JCM 4913]